MRTVAIANQKGGVGKSTTTYHLAQAVAASGRRVLVVDADPQGNITSVLAEEIESDWVGLADLLSARTDVTVRDVLVPGIWPGLTLLPTPSTENLTLVRDELVASGPGRELRLAEALREVAGDFDVCFIDCPPSLDQLTINALTAADSVTIVTEAGKWAADGLAQFLSTVEAVRRYYNDSLRVDGVLVNRYEPKTLRALHWVEELIEGASLRGITVFSPLIPKRVILAEATEAGATLADYGPDGRELAEIYRQLAADLVPATAQNGAL